MNLNLNDLKNALGFSDNDTSATSKEADENIIDAKYLEIIKKYNLYDLDLNDSISELDKIELDMRSQGELKSKEYVTIKEYLTILNAKNNINTF